MEVPTQSPLKLKKRESTSRGSIFDFLSKLGLQEKYFKLFVEKAGWKKMEELYLLLHYSKDKLIELGIEEEDVDVLIEEIMRAVSEQKTTAEVVGPQRTCKYIFNINYFF